MLITFSGLDGAGKSTLIAWLRSELEREDRRVVVFHMNDHIGLYAYLRMLRDVAGRRWRGAGDGVAGRVPGAAEQPVPTTRPPGVGDGSRHATSLLRRVRDALLWSRWLRRFVYPVDLVIFLGYRLCVERFAGCVLIMDRYFYDTLVDVSDGRNWRVIRYLEKITPAPTMSVYLDITPEESYARKGEYTVDYLRRRRGRYREVFGWLPTAISLPGHDLDATRMMLERVVRERIAS